MKIGFIGMGNMAKAIAVGLISSGKVVKNDIYAYAPNQDKLNANADEVGFTAVANLHELVNASELLIMACKPYQIDNVIREIGNDMKGKALVSIAAGWVHENFENILDASVRVQCIMPNTPAMVGEGVFLFEERNTLTTEEECYVKDIFGALGIVEVLPTRLMGIGGAISGCGPAFMDLVIEAYADAAVKYGIARPTAYRLVSQTMLGSAKLQLDTGKQPGQLKDEVCSPAGTTIRGVCALEKAGFRSACVESIDAIMDMKRS